MGVQIRVMIVVLAALCCLSAPSVTDSGAIGARSGLDRHSPHAVRVAVQPLTACGRETQPVPVRSAAVPELPGFLAVATAVTALAGIINRRKR